MRLGFQADPENTCGLRRGEESVPTERNFADGHENARQGLLDVLHGRVWLFSNEFQCDVQRFRPDPARVRSEVTDSLDESAEPLADGAVDIECDEEPHSKQ